MGRLTGRVGVVVEGVEAAASAEGQGEEEVGR